MGNDRAESLIEVDGRPEMVPLMTRSLRFANGMFHHMTRTRDAATCRRAAELARAAASSDQGQQPLAYLAHAAWWDAVADRCRDHGDSGGVSGGYQRDVPAHFS